MRPADDLAFRARNWFWYWRVRAISGLNNGQLDRQCFGADGRRRHFERLESSASDPHRVALVDGRTLLEIISEWDPPTGEPPDAYSKLSGEYHSALWEMLTLHDRPAGHYTDYLQRFAQSRGWVRIHAKDRSLYQRFLGEDEPAVQSDVSTAYSAMLHQLVNEATPDALAALVALFREALQAIHLKQAMAIETALRAAPTWICEFRHLPRWLGLFLRRLVHDRVFSNRSATECNAGLVLNRSEFGAPMNSRARIQAFQVAIKAYIRGVGAPGPSPFGHFPMVPSSERIRWLEHNRTALEAELDTECENRQCTGGSSNSPEPGDIADPIDEVPSNPPYLPGLRPPACAPAVFFRSRPHLELGQLPAAFDVQPGSTKGNL